MRFALVGCIALLSAVAVPLGAAQVGSASLDVMAKVAEARPAGQEVAVLFTVTRHCASPASVLPEQVVEVAILSRDANATVTGPGQVVFPQQVCATEARRSVDVAYGVRTPRDALPGDVFVFRAIFEPRFGGTPSIAGPGNEASMDFTVGVAADEEGLDRVEAISTGQEQLEAPGLPAILLALALLGAAFALRRRA